MIDRIETKYNQIVGIKGDLVYVLKESFQYSEDGMRGCTGYAMETLSQEYIDRANDLDKMEKEFEYLWREAVANGQTKLGLRDYVEELEEDYIYDNRYFIGDDNSFRCDFNEIVDNLPEDQKETLERYFGEKEIDFVDWNCVSNGRCFEPNEKWDEVFNPELLEVINQFEGR